MHTLILAYPDPPEFYEYLFDYSYSKYDENGNRYCLHPLERHDYCSGFNHACDHCTLAEPGEIIYVVEIPEKTLVVPVGSLEKYRNAPGWSDFGTIVEGVDFEGVPLIPEWEENEYYYPWNQEYNIEEKPDWIHQDDWDDWMATKFESKNLEDIDWKNLPDIQYIVKDGIIYWENSHGEAEIIGPADRDSSDYKFSEKVEINGRLIPVTKIHGYAFANFSHLNSEVLPSSIKEIGNYAFANASGSNPLRYDLDYVKKIITVR